MLLFIETFESVYKTIKIKIFKIVLTNLCVNCDRSNMTSCTFVSRNFDQINY